ncbi:hypothetical protein PFFVO_06108 [Plasmodium falciparum Vietnam Oak-Knoll (FVO)]|uniref:Duffy-binding-like domain-containing protein n=3 Tax=Plasmodium falciparum TaxID=5833 RepID=A0A024UY81_PLAFA|nr:hypothetical protein PFFVO_06108 [Plasmodium falciparum Vietnam Oak-Knoll (FVO)]
MVIQITGGEGRIEDATAKHLLDSIGKKVYDKVHSEVDAYRDKLKGTLSKATYPKDKYPEGTTPKDPCELEYKYHTNVTSTEIDPCEHKKGKRLSEVHSSECDNRKIRDSDKKNNSVGACAPYRRLHVCDKNIQQIKTENITTHNLLLDVCLAAKFEGQSITGYHPQYEVQYPSSGSTMCTMLARSFADIGDIVRGKDLYIGNKGEKKKLEEKLKQYFKKIYNDLTKDNIKRQEAQKRYQDDKYENYYQLREDWWNANRQEIWKALTCDAPNGDVHYFRKTCSMGQSHVNDKCTCANGDVPTYFDYVPQYLRWFEEWAEDFCRKRKKKLENAIKNCRYDESGEPKYCDLNGYNCEETARGRNKFAPDSNCNKCSVACKPFVEWLDNQQKEFEKQKKKYNEEIKKKDQTTRTSITIGDKTINNLYVKEFYEQLRENYGKVEEFLKKLNNEAICQKNPQVKQEKASNVDFTKSDPHDIFSHTKYCQACPLCGVTGEKGKWEAIKEDCAKKKERIFNEQNTTDIPILTPEKGKSNILDKYKNFCKNSDGNNSDQIEKWQCYYDDKGTEDNERDDTNDCVQGIWKTFTGEQDVTSYNVFFYNSIIEMLNDSIEWREKLNSCINNKTGNCRKVCKEYCECYRRWIEKKKTELEKIKDHFRKQKDIKDPAEREMTLTGILNVTFLEDIKDAYPYEQQLEKIEKRLKDKMQEDFIFERTQTSIDKFLQEEEQFAKECLEKHKCPDPQKPPGGGPGVARSETNEENATQSPASPTEDSEEEEDEDEVEVEGSATEDPPAVPSATPVPAGPPVNVCDIVEKILTKDALQDACQQKYDGKYYGWKCIPSGTTSGDKGAICIPPRRRRLYMGKLEEWATTSVTPQAGGGEAQASDSSQSSSHPTSPTSQSPNGDLLAAFVESAAVETFFLWHRYKKEWHHKNKKPQEGSQLLQTTLDRDSGDGGDQTPEQQLQSGTIPTDFLRLMFYTLADYKDILYSGGVDNTSDSDNNIVLEASGDKQDEMKKIQKAIDEYIKSLKQAASVPKPQPPGQQPSEKKREEWWNNNAKHIWEGMICALTHKTDNPQEVDEKVKKAFFGENNNKNPGTTSGTTNGTYKTQYDYNSVKLDNSDTQAKSNDNPTLEEFSKRPTFFRYIQEWGEEFCRKRTHKLKKLEKECRGEYDNGGKKYCSGDGHDCTDPDNQHNKMFADLFCRDCHIQCRKYRKWIDLKFEEFHKQKDKYDGEFQKIKVNNNGDKNCCEQIKNYSSAAEFLKELKHCKNGEGDKEKGNEDKKNNKINFEEPLQTFSRSTYCKTCPLNGVNCNGPSRRSGGNDQCTEVNGKVKSWQSVFNANGGNSTTIDVHMIDRRGTFIEEYMQEDSKNSQNSNDLFNASRLFKGIRKQQWECRFNKAENKDVCKLDKFEKNIDLNDYTTFKVFLEYWLQDFIEGYYILKKRKIMDHCTKSGGNTCSEESKKNCACAKVWVDQKKKEWEEIKNHFNRRPHDNGNDIKSKVRNFLETLIPRMDLVNDKGKIDDLSIFLKSYGCNGTENSKESKKDENNDLVLCLLTKLGKEAEQCKDKPPNCDNLPSPSDKTLDPLVEEEINPIDDDTDTTDKQSPDICKDVEDTKEPETDSDIFCDRNKQPKCDDLKIDMNTTYKPKTNLIGLGAHYHWAGSDYPNVYISPRVDQLCLQPLINLTGSLKKSDSVTGDKFSEALQECAYNEAKLLYEYYKGEGKENIYTKNGIIKEEDIKQHTLEAMKRSYADYGNIVKDDVLWNYKDNYMVNELIFDIANKNNQIQNKSLIDYETKQRKTLWESIRNDIWKAMLCGYKKAGGCMKNLPNGGEFCTLPSTDKDNQFLRWFVEWGENFCIRREQELKQLKDKCKNGICKITDEGEIQECKSLCGKYWQFLSNSKTQYEKQSILYNQLKESTSEFQNTDPFTFLKDKCSSKFSCFGYKADNNVSKIFEYPSDEVKNLCTCTSTDTSKTTPTNCIEKAAYELQKEATNKIGSASNSLKIKDNVIDLSDCRKGNYVVVDNGVDGKKIDKDMLKKMFPSNRYSCEPNEINSFHIGKAWDCNYRNINDRDKNLCLPPRRQFMCMKKIEHISAKDVKDKENLLRIVMEIAKEEGIRILRNYQEQNKTQFSEICDDMKYSFADLGDIIRGRDLWKEYPNYHTTEQNLQRIFKNIHNEITKGGDKDKYKYDRQYFHELRNDWWNTNREAIWKAMTCCAPRHAYIYKKTNTGDKIRSTDMYYYCGYTKEPPYDDYIPQRLRWMKEWGEYVCKILNEKINDIKNECDKCKLNDPNCLNKDDGNKCKSCKEKCREYNKLIHNLKSQLDIQKEIYKELYKKIKDNGIRFTTDSDKEVIEFLKEVEKTGCDVKSFDKYLDKTSHCINYKFNEKEKEKETYAFNLNPKVYKEKCKCGITKDPLDKCPDQNTCTKYHAIQCFGKEHDDNAYWLSTYIKDNKAIIKNVLVPPRRRHLCLRIYRAKFYHLRKEINNFKEFIFSSAFSEAKRLKKVYKDDNDKLLQAMKYSFADIGNIVKGDDMMQSPTSDNIAKIFRGMKYKGIDRTKWWNENKYHVWESMLCGYRKAVGNTQTNLNCRFPDIESVPQFLRWFQEWTEIFCKRKKELEEEAQNQCNNITCDKDTGRTNSICAQACKNYSNFILIKKNEYQSLNSQYDMNYKETKAEKKESPEYFKDKCNGECSCLSEYFKDETRWKNPYESIADKALKGKCNCKKVEPPPIQPPQADEPLDPTILQTTIPFGVALALGSIAFLFLKVKVNIYIYV